MKDIVKLNSEIEKIYNPEIIFYENCNNILFNGYWVSEINYLDYSDWLKRIKKKILKIADLGNSNKIVYLKTFHQDILEKYNSLVQTNYEDLQDLLNRTKTEFLLPDSIKKPKWTNRDGYRAKDDLNNKFEIIMDKMAAFFQIEDWDTFTASQDLEYGEWELEDLITDKLQIKNENSVNEFEKFYAYAHLSHCLDIHKQTLKAIVDYTDKVVQFIKKIENFEEDKLSLDIINDLDPNNLKLEFKINKMDVALFYRILHDVGIIYVDNKNQKHPYTNLKKYIDNSNMYYLENKKVDKVTKINKEFAKFLNDNRYEKHEKALIDLLISKLKSRKEEIEANYERGLR